MCTSEREIFPERLEPPAGLELGPPPPHLPFNILRSSIKPGSAPDPNGEFRGTDNFYLQSENMNIGMRNFRQNSKQTPIKSYFSYRVAQSMTDQP